MRNAAVPAIVLATLLAGCSRASEVTESLQGANSVGDGPSNRTCELAGTNTKPSSTGHVVVTAASGGTHSLSYAKIDARTQPARGTLFYLAGGPISHMLYTDMAAAFQAAAFHDLDVVLYDYYGFNCSTALQDVNALDAEVANLTVPAMAQDFLQLKRSLIGNTKAFLMGGSHGAMLGAQILADAPDEIAKAVLFSGDTETGWLEGGWRRFDRLMTKLDGTHAGFAASLDRLLAMAEDGSLTITEKGATVAVDRPSLEVALWMAFGMDAAAQAALPELVDAALAGEAGWIGAILSTVAALLEPIGAAPPPTESSVVTHFHRCTVFFPRSQRAIAAGAKDEERFFRVRSLVDYWNRLCKDYDRLGEHPLAVRPVVPTRVPVLAWVGDQDLFDPIATRTRWAGVSADLSFTIMAGWAHDFGPDPAAGFDRIVGLIRPFLATER